MRTGTLAVCNGTTMVIRQYQFSCINLDGQIMWNAVVSGSDSFVQTLNPTATLVQNISSSYFPDSSDQCGYLHLGHYSSDSTCKKESSSSG